ncbi:MAG: IMP cyclohydrolase, partial [Patescibacteria group bacterium]
MNDLNKIAGANLCALKQNPYPGRGIVLGLDEKQESFIQIYWVTGRSFNSRNRILDSEFGRVFTLAADPSRVKDPSLIIYDAMQENDGFYV